MTSAPHLGEARRRALDALSDIVDADETIKKAVLGQDLFGILRVILWLGPGADEGALRARVSDALAACGRFWRGDVWVCSAATSRADSLVYGAAWDDGITVPGVDKLRIDDRTRTRSAWLPRFRDPPWKARRSSPAARSPEAPLGEGPPIIVFYSFKGGVGRTTALAAFAILRAREGERVLVIDFDLDAPGAGTLLAADRGEEMPRGVVDYLLEALLGDVDLEDYVHRCKREPLVGDMGGEIIVMPAGSVDDDYLAKLSRLDLEIRGDEHPLDGILHEARDGLRPDWILIDSRAGLSPLAGVVLDGIAHLHVLFGTNSAQSQLGLRQVIRQLGEERVVRDLPQASCLIVQAMVVDLVGAEEAARSQFNAWLEKTLTDHYVVREDDDPEDRLWSVRDLNSSESPNRSIAVLYRTRLAFFSAVDEVAKDLVAGPYLEIGARILGQFNVGDSVDEED
jgi:cellulose biosynthesis protein BcsQ